MRSVIAFLLLLGVVSADEIRIDHREGTTGNFSPVRLTTLPNYVLTFDANGNPIIGAMSGGPGGVSDGDKGDITVTASGATWTVDAGAVSLAKMANLAQAKLIGRWTASTGVPEAITIGADFLTTAGTLSLAVAPQPLDADLTDLADGSLTGSKVGSGIDGGNITAGTVLDARIDAAIARDSEVTAAIAAAVAGYQPLDADLTDLAGLSAAQGDIIIGNGAGDWVKLAKGTASQVLQMNAGATLPEWAAASGGGIAAGDSPTWTGAHTFTRAGAASAPTISLTGLPFTGGTATTTKPLMLLEPTGATSTGWSTAGTMLGANAASGFAGNLIDAQVNGLSKFKASSDGILVPYGTAAAPSLAIGQSDVGWLHVGSGVMATTHGSSLPGVVIYPYFFRLSSGQPLHWASGNSQITNGDVGLSRLGPANIGQGLLPSATPIAQTFTIGEASRPGTDSNVAGASGTIQSGLGTGTGTASSLIFQTPTVAASGSAVQTYATRLTLNAAGAAFTGNVTAAASTTWDLSAANVLLGTATGLPVEFCVAMSDETTAITTGTAKVTMRSPYAFTVTSLRASVNTVSSSGIPTVDVNEAGTSIISTKLTIDASEKTSVTAAAAHVISDSAIADDAELTFDIDVAGTGAKGLKVWVYGNR